MRMTTRRQRVLAYLRAHARVSARQVGRALGLSTSNVRHHLSVLLADGRITAVGRRRTTARGRPEALFGVSDALRGTNLAGLSEVLLDRLQNGLSPPGRRAVLRSVGVELSRRLGTANARALEVKGLNAIVSRLSALHYEARWEAGAEGPRFLFGHCPYAAIIQRHPELCEVDGELLEAVTGHSMYQHAKIGEQGSLVCMFSRAAPADAEPLRGFNV